MHEGHTFGLVAGDEGLLCLTGSESDMEPYERLRGWVGRDVEIFGVLADGTDMPVVQVTVSRIRSTDCLWTFLRDGRCLQGAIRG